MKQKGNQQLSADSDSDSASAADSAAVMQADEQCSAGVVNGANSGSGGFSGWNINTLVSRGVIVPIIVFLACMLLTMVVRYSVTTLQTEHANSRFSHIADELVNRVEKVVFDHASLMADIRAFFHASEEVTRQEFHDFLGFVNLRKRFPGVEGIGWVPRIDRADLQAFESQVEADQSINPDGYPGFRVKPLTNSAELYAVKYLYSRVPTKNVLGFDLGSDPLRREVIERARDSGKMIATSPVQLVSETRPMGFVLFIPVYSKTGLETSSQRRQHFQGVVSGAFTFKALMQAAMTEEPTSVQVFDESRPNHLRSAFFSAGVADVSHATQVRGLSVAGRRWSFEFSQNLQDLHTAGGDLAARMLLIFGVAISAISAVLAWSLVTSRNRAMSVVERLTSDLTKANKNLLRSNKDLTQFAFIASHDLQTPVRNVGSTITLLEGALGDDLTPSVASYLGYLRQSSTRMQALVSDLLGYARSDHEDIKLEYKNLNQIVSTAMDSIRHVLEQSEAVITVSPLPDVMCDAAQLVRVFINLIDNSIKYRHQERPVRIYIDSVSAGTEWHIHIRDNGLGIATKHQDRVFEPFQRLHRQDEIEGTGLGLSICRQILENHNGYLEIESTSEQGTAFLLRMPQASALQHAA